MSESDLELSSGVYRTRRAGSEGPPVSESDPAVVFWRVPDSQSRVRRTAYERSDPAVVFWRVPDSQSRV